MPTGYTANIENGDITTGKDFLTLCCRAFGVCIDMRDEPMSQVIPDSFEPDKYYKERYDRAVIKLEEVRGLTVAEVIDKIAAEKKGKEESIKKQIESNKILNEKYHKVQNEIESWIPPTPEHTDLKKFALDQIAMSNRDYSDYYTRELESIHKNISPEDYLSEWIDMCEDEVRRAKKSYDDEINRANGRNEWLKKFRDSFNPNS